MKTSVLSGHGILLNEGIPASIWIKLWCSVKAARKPTFYIFAVLSFDRWHWQLPKLTQYNKNIYSTTTSYRYVMGQRPLVLTSYILEYMLTGLELVEDQKRSPLQMGFQKTKIAGELFVCESSKEGPFIRKVDWLRQGNGFHGLVWETSSLQCTN